MTDLEAHIDFKKLLLRIWRECNNDNVAGTAAELSYYFLLALFPLLIFLTSLIGFLPDAPSGLIDYVARVAPPDALKLVRSALQRASVLFELRGSAKRSLGFSHRVADRETPACGRLAERSYGHRCL